MKPIAPGDLFDAADREALPLLDRADELGRLQERRVRAAVSSQA
jgi:hypothetical protein